MILCLRLYFVLHQLLLITFEIYLKRILTCSVISVCLSVCTLPTGEINVFLHLLHSLHFHPTQLDDIKSLTTKPELLGSVTRQHHAPDFLPVLMNLT